MKNIILITVASTLLLASGAWAGGPPLPVGISTDKLKCWVLDSEEAFIAFQNWDVEVMHTVEAGRSGNLNASCGGQVPWLNHDDEMTRSIRYNYANTNRLCRVNYGNGQNTWTQNWQQVLTPEGDFMLKCRNLQTGPEPD